LDLSAGFVLDGEQLLPCMDEMQLADKFYDAYYMLAGSIKCHGIFSLYKGEYCQGYIHIIKILRKNFHCPDKHAPSKAAQNDCNVTGRFGCV